MVYAGDYSAPPRNGRLGAPRVLGSSVVGSELAAGAGARIRRNVSAFQAGILNSHPSHASESAAQSGTNGSPSCLVMHGTIPHDQLSKEGAAKVLIKPAAHGTGVIAGGSMRAVLEAAGITDVLAKNLGSANPHNVVKATIKALSSLREPIAVSKTRNISLKKVFNG